jgi:hypothetical protein
MTAIDRRSMLTCILCGAAVAAVGVIVMPNAAESTPLAIGMGGVVKTEDIVEKAQVVVVPPVRRRRRWVCWWHGGRRVCGWRW